MGQHIFSPVQSAPTHLTGWDFLETHDLHISFSQKGEMYLEVNESYAEPVEKVTILREAPHGDTDLETERLLQGAPVGSGPFPGQILGRSSQSLLSK